jgi:hypothetical protein
LVYFAPIGCTIPRTEAHTSDANNFAVGNVQQLAIQSQNLINENFTETIATGNFTGNSALDIAIITRKNNMGLPQNLWVV